MCSEEVTQESASAPNDTTVPTPDETRKKPASRAVRDPLPKNLPRQERIITLPTRECTSTRCGENKKLIGFECSERRTINLHRNIRGDHQAGKTCVHPLRGSRNEHRASAGSHC